MDPSTCEKLLIMLIICVHNPKRLGSVHILTNSQFSQHSDTVTLTHVTQGRMGLGLYANTASSCSRQRTPLPSALSSLLLSLSVMQSASGACGH